MKEYVLDSSAIITFLEDRVGSVKVEEIIKQANAGSARTAISVINWGEVLYSMVHKRPPEGADQVRQSIRQLSIEKIPVDLQRAERAAEIKVRHRLGYADAFAAELAMERNAILVTSDGDFQRIQRQVKILWINRKH